MMLLFELDLKNYDKNGKVFNRPSARAIIIKDKKIYMIHSLLFDYYKFPGGGIEKEETNLDALIRETAEEAGLIVIKDSIKEYGYVNRIQQSDKEEYSIFMQENYYYICEVENQKINQKLDDYEDYEKFTLELVDPRIAIETNRNNDHGNKDMVELLREAKVLELLIKEGYFE